MTATHPTLESPAWTAPHRAVVVGIDGSEHNRAAVEWAVAEAEVTGRPLTLLSVLEEYAVPRPRPRTMAVPGPRGDWDVLMKLSDRLQHRHPKLTIRRDVQLGAAVQTLVERAALENTLVVGRRGLGTFARILVGSTSIGVAGRCHVPVVVVPDGWDQQARRTKPVVVGIDPNDIHEQTLLHAFNEAERRRVPLVVAHALDLEGKLTWDPGLIAAYYDQLRARHAEAVERALAPLRPAFPAVEVRVAQEACHPGSLILKYDAGAQLVVLGRHHDGRFGGFPVGSVARGVLHCATAPVAVVPGT